MNRLSVAALVVVVVLIAVGVVLIVLGNAHSRQRDRDLIARLETVRLGVCALRRERKQSIAALITEVAKTRKFLVRFPGGLPSIHVSRADIEQSLRSQEANIKLQRETVKALAVVRCKP